jgi:hypothetical protein
MNEMTAITIMKGCMTVISVMTSFRKNYNMTDMTDIAVIETPMTAVAVMVAQSYPFAAKFALPHYKLLSKRMIENLRERSKIFIIRLV